MKVSFLGAGLYGEALGGLAESNDHEIKYYDPYRFPEVTLSQAISEAEAIVYVAPASAYRELLPGLPVETPLILASKGFVSMKPFEKFQDFSALGGAAFAEDIMEMEKMKKKRGESIYLTASSPLSEVLFTTDFLTIEHTNDTKGIMLLGALKNVYAIGAGMMMNSKRPGDYLTQAYLEMRDILELNGAKPETAELACGVPDLVISCTTNGRNFRFGREIKEHPKSRVEPAGTVEGLTVINSLAEFTDFTVPPEAELFVEIVKRVRKATN